jgi:hypothetical protein
LVAISHAVLQTAMKLLFLAGCNLNGQLRLFRRLTTDNTIDIDGSTLSLPPIHQQAIRHVLTKRSDQMVIYNRIIPVYLQIFTVLFYFIHSPARIAGSMASVPSVWIVNIHYWLRCCSIAVNYGPRWLIGFAFAGIHSVLRGTVGPVPGTGCF